MLTVGFPISLKENEKRRAILPQDIKKISNKDKVYIEKGYGEVFKISDEEYLEAGVKVVSRNEIFTKDIICDPKVGDAEYIYDNPSGKIYFGWLHAVQNPTLSNHLVKNRATAIAWEDMDEKGRHVFWRNNELAGEAAILHAFTLYNKLPYDCKVAIIGNGNTARGAYNILSKLGANIHQFNRKSIEILKENLKSYDVIVNAVLWDTNRKDHLIYRTDLSKMKKNSMIIDISCDLEGAIQTSYPTTIEKPVYTTDNVLHYVVDHTPALVSFSATIELSNIVSNLIDILIEEKFSTHPILSNAIIIDEGIIKDNRIIEYQKKGVKSGRK